VSSLRKGLEALADECEADARLLRDTPAKLPTIQAANEESLLYFVRRLRALLALPDDPQHRNEYVAFVENADNL
jgi:hypothetical protein